MLGDKLGDSDALGETEGDILGDIEGDMEAEGLTLGDIEGDMLGEIDGLIEALGDTDGEIEGDLLGDIEGEIEGEIEPAFGSEKSSKYKSSDVPPPFKLIMFIPVDHALSGEYQSVHAPHSPSFVLYLNLNL